MRKYFLAAACVLPGFLMGQQPKDNLGDKEYIIVKDYKPILAESYKISDTPDGDTSTTESGALTYSIRSKKADTEYESATIKAVKIKDEQLAKLYRSYVKLGVGNYTTYNGELYVNSLRSKKGALNLNARHFSADPGLGNVGPAGFSNNHAGVNGRYFLEHSTFTGDFNYDRNVVHYYGYNTNDTIIDKKDIRQRFNQFGVRLGLGSNYSTSDHFNYNGSFSFNTINDLYGVAENDFLVDAKGSKMVGDKNIYAGLSFDFFKKTRADKEPLTIYSDLARNIVSFSPGISFDKDKVKLDLGLNLTLEKNLDNTVHFFPRINVTIPIADDVLYAFAGANGNVIKNSYQTVVSENKFVAPAILLNKNTINKIELKAGLNGNFSSTISFLAMVKYSTVGDMLLYVNDGVNFNTFNTLYRDGKVFNIHAELGYKASDKFNAAIRFDQYTYKMDFNEKAWHRPASEVSLNANYNLWEKLIIKASLYSRGSFYVRQNVTGGFVAQKVNGFVDGNLGIEYRYSKVLSIYLNMNNLGFSRYYYWYQYPNERLNVLGGLTYAF